MPKAYIINNAAKRSDIPAPPEYLAKFREGLVRLKGRVLIGTEEIDWRKGNLNLGRLVVVEFADKASAVAAYEWYMRDVAPLRPGGTIDMFIVEGIE
jgi:uncharacterized protein (DUF1330 family)